MLLRKLYVGYRQSAVKKFLTATENCEQVQKRVLLQKIRRNESSDFGKEHHFDKIRSVADFRRQLPITTYEYYRPWVERMKKGDARALLGENGRVLMFAMTSGTTSASKYIPITADFLSEYRRSWQVWGLKTFHDHPDLIRKKVLQISSDWRSSHTEAGIPCGNISGLAAEMRPLIARPTFLLPNVVNKVSDTVGKQYTALRVAIASARVGMIVTANPLTLLGIARLGDSHRESIIRDLHDGTLSQEVDVPDQVRDGLRRKLKANPKRARQLSAIAEKTGTLYPKDYWPGLSVLAIWTGGSVGVYVPKLKEFYGETAFRDHGLSATEGRMTTPLQDGSSAGILDIVTHYFEFIPEEEHGSPDATVLEGHELEIGKNYYLVLTTSSGIYRHDIHDVVRCQGFQGTTPILDFLNKGAHFSSLTGEKLSEMQVVEAVRGAHSELGLPMEEFTLVPYQGDPAGYILLTESDLDSQKAARTFDAHLAKANCEYDNRLETGRLAPLAVQRVPSGTWAAFRRERLRRSGGSLEQYKHPCLLNDTTLVDQVLDEMGVQHLSGPHFKVDSKRAPQHDASTQFAKSAK